MKADEMNLSPSELRTILDHKKALSEQKGYQVSVEEAIEHYFAEHAEEWRTAKLRQDNVDQFQEIEKHKWLQSEAEQQDIGRHRAAVEWCDQYAHLWRAERESLERNGFQQVTVVAGPVHELVKGSPPCVEKLLSRYDIYVHKKRMPRWSFYLNWRPYLNIRSDTDLASLGIKSGDEMEIISSGVHTREALLLIAELLFSAK